MGIYLEDKIKTDVAVIIPCLNERATIAETCRRFKAELPDATICVGDNNSTDGTAGIALAEPCCDIVMKCPVPGKGAATRDMVRRIQAGWYITVDGDMTYGPENVQKMLSIAKKAASWNDNIVVTGERALSRGNQRPLHKPGNKLVDILVGIRYGTHVRDVMTGYRVVPGQLFRDFVDRSPYDGFEIETAFVMYALSRGYELVYVPCAYSDRPDGSKSKLRTIRDGMKVLKAVVSKI